MDCAGAPSHRILELGAWALETADILNNVTPKIIEYHSIGVPGGYDNLSVATFRSHLDWLTDTYDVVPLADLFEPSPAATKSVALTFDDGLASFAEVALPVLKAYDAPATVFAMGASVEEPTGITHDAILRERLRTPDPLMSGETLRTLTEEPLVTIGAHTMTHPELPMLQHGQQLEREIVGSKEALEAALGVSIDQFAYPYDEWSIPAHRLVQQHFDLGVQNGGEYTLIWDITDRHLLPRICGGVCPHQLAIDLHDVSAYTRTLIRELLSTPRIVRERHNAQQTNEQEVSSHRTTQ